MWRRFTSSLFQCGGLLNDISRSQAKWDIEASKYILKSRRKFLLFAVIPVFVLLLAQAAIAAGILPTKIPVLGGSKAYMPSFVNTKMFFGSILVGIIAGLITGVIGAGGGYVLTPALMSFGVRGIMAVGTDQFHLFAKAIMGTAIHKKMGNVNFGLAAWFIVGSLPGAWIGGKVNRTIFQHSPAMSDALISAVYVIVLGVLGIYAVADWIRLRNVSEEETETKSLTALAKTLQSIKIKPLIHFDQNIVPGGRTLPVYPVIVCGLIVGFVASIMGVGGGFLIFPMFVSGLGVSTLTTVGTSIFQVLATNAYSSIAQYAIYGFVFYTVAIGMLIGSLVGVQIGAMVTKIVKGSVIRMFYALTILAGFANRLFVLPRKLGDLGYISISRDTSSAIETTGTVIFFAIISIFALWILSVFIRNIPKLRAGEKKKTGRKLVINPGKLYCGIAGLLIFSCVLVIGFQPIINGENALQWADRLFNQLSKQSAYYIPSAQKDAGKYIGKAVDFSVNPRDMADDGKIVQIVRSNGFTAKQLDDGRVRVTGDLGKLGKSALIDAELAFNNRNKEIKTKYNMTSEEAIYHWWIIFDGLSRRYVQENLGSLANFTKYIETKVLEPAYNFRGIKAIGIEKDVCKVTGLLLFYIAFTIWYGVSILFIFEGFGIAMTGNSAKKEAKSV